MSMPTSEPALPSSATGPSGSYEPPSSWKSEAKAPLSSDAQIPPTHPSTMKKRESDSVSVSSRVVDAPVELVVFADDDADDPKNWPRGRKVGVVAILAILSFVGVLGSSSYAPGEQQVRRMFGVNADVASTGLTVYVLGFALGPLLWGPASEMYGRRLPYMLSWPLLIVSVALSAWIDNLPVIMIFRFFSGCFAGCPLNNGSGIISDLYASTPRALGKSIGIYAFTALSGPVIGSIIGFFVAAHLTHGLWVIRIHWFMVIAIWPLVFFLPETHGPTILTRRARKLRAAGKDNAFAAHELHSVTKKELAWKHVGRPFAMLAIEPIVIGAAAWVALSYSIIYFFFEAFPVVFVEQNHFSFQLGGLPFLGITLGMTVCLLSTDRLTQMSRHVHIPFVDPPGVGTPADAPEAGLKVVLIACLITPISLFWFAWTSTGNVHWISPVIAGVFFGYSMLGTFYAFNAYSTQVYTIYASSASASNTLFRSVVACIFPIIAHPILNNLGTTWGVSLFGFLSLGLVPVPMIFVRYGKQLREKSHFAREAQRVMDDLRRQHVLGADLEDLVDGAGELENEAGVEGEVTRRASVEEKGLEGATNSKTLKGTEITSTKLMPV